MNVYDEAHSLARAIKESNEFKEFEQISAEVKKDEQLTEMIKEVREISFQVQAAQLGGQEPDPAIAARMQTVYTMLSTKPLAMKYIEAETRMQLMMKDVFDIIGEAMGPMAI